MPDTITRMTQTHPVASPIPTDVLDTCIAACIECAQACTACADACLGEEAIVDLVTCIQLDQDCADICDATGRVLSRHVGEDTTVIEAVVRACAKVCRACALECERHTMHEHCVVCADVCRRCEEACERVLATIW